ncbi:MAG: MATE family efflux transporter [Gammaproteobacteria bacterium]
MKDLTHGSITSHILTMSLVMLIGMVGQTAYFLVDLYFVAHLGPEAVAGVNAAGTLSFVVLALTQILGVGTVSLIAHAVGRQDKQDANTVFNQSVVLSAICAGLTLIAGYLFTGAYMRSVGADAEMQANGITYLRWFLPGLALQFALVSMGQALRGTGIVKPGTVVQLLTVGLNILLAPVLIAGWGTGVPMGVAGAGLASTIAVGVGVVMLTVYFIKLEHYVGFDSAQWKPKLAYCKRILNIGFPAGGEFFLMFITMAMMYWLIRNFGADAQAGYGIGSRIMQAILMPAMAVAFSASPIAGQNYGARRADRVRETFHKAAMIELVIMAVVTALCHIAPQAMIAPFSDDPEVVAVGTLFLRIISWNFIASGFMFTCSGMFQAIGNTWPAMWSGVMRLALFGIPAVWLSTQPGFNLEQIFHWSVITVFLQAGLTYWLLRVQLKKRLVFAPAPARAAA